MSNQNENGVVQNNKKTIFAIIFIKFWVSGIIYFLLFNSLLPHINPLDRLVILWLVLALAYEYIVNNIIIYLSNSWYDTTKFIVFKAKDRKSYKSLLLTLLYVLIVFSMTMFGVWIWSELYKVVKIPTVGMLLFGTKAFGIDSVTFSLILLINETIVYALALLYRKWRGINE